MTDQVLPSFYAQGAMDLTGPAGPTGPQGPQGPQGPTGSQGVPGPEGVQGEIGPQGIQGPAGPTGPQGPAGPEGPTGLTGSQGPKGDKGDTGLTGPQGAASTVPGPQGPKGDKGDTGATGPAGPQGPVGPQGPTGEGGGGSGDVVSTAENTFTKKQTFVGEDVGYGHPAIAIDSGNRTNQPAINVLNLGGGAASLIQGNSQGCSDYVSVASRGTIRWQIDATNRTWGFGVNGAAYDSSPEAFIFKQAGSATRGLVTLQNLDAGGLGNMLQAKDSAGNLRFRVMNSGALDILTDPTTNHVPLSVDQGNRTNVPAINITNMGPGNNGVQMGYLNINASGYRTFFGQYAGGMDFVSSFANDYALGKPSFDFLAANRSTLHSIQVTHTGDTVGKFFRAVGTDAAEKFSVDKDGVVYAKLHKFDEAGVGAPTFDTSSPGTKLLAYPGVSVNTVDYAMGVEANNIWFSVPWFTGGMGFKYYAGTTLAAHIRGDGVVYAKTGFLTDGNLQVGTNISATGTIITASTIQGHQVKATGTLAEIDCYARDGSGNYHAMYSANGNHFAFWSSAAGERFALTNLGATFYGTLEATGTITQGGVAVSLSGHTHTFASLTAKPTTLAGYGITDAATATHNHDATYARKATVSTAAPSGGVDGDVWYKV